MPKRAPVGDGNIAFTRSRMIRDRKRDSGIVRALRFNATPHSARKLFEISRCAHRRKAFNNSKSVSGAEVDVAGSPSIGRMARAAAAIAPKLVSTEIAMVEYNPAP
jgi:hypothetical protein